MEVFSLRLRRATGPKQFHSAVLSSLQSVVAVGLLVRIAWPYSQFRTLTLVSAIAFLLLVVLELYRVWRFHKVAYPKAEAGDQAMTQALNVNMKTHLWANVGFALLALAVFQFSLLVK